MKNLVKRKIFPVLFSMIFIMSCSYQKIEKEAPFVNTISQNKKFTVNLPENHSNGYLWHFNETHDPTVVSYLNSVWHGNAKGVDFNFNTLAAGQTTLTFILKKRLDTSDVKHFIVEIGAK
jgi:hypothetical protein